MWGCHGQIHGVKNSMESYEMREICDDGIKLYGRMMMGSWNSGLEISNKSLRNVNFIIWVMGSPEFPEVAKHTIA